MDKIIPLNKGIHRQPSLGEAGELSECVNLIPQNGELVNVKPASNVRILEVEEGYRLICVHKVDTRTNYIFSKGESCKYYTSDGESGDIEDLFDVGEIESAVAVGYMLVFTSSTNNAYLRWMGDRYDFLGTRIPHLNVLARTEFYRRTFPNNRPTADEILEFGEGDRKDEKTIGDKLVEKYKAKLNDLRKQYFVEPFMLKYAYKMYDGSIIDCSPPILMPCSTKYPALYAKVEKGVSDFSVFYYYFTHVAYVSPIKDSSELETLRAMADLIQSVEFYISPINLYGDKVNYVENQECMADNVVIGYDHTNDKYGGVSFSEIKPGAEDHYMYWWSLNNQEEINERVIGASDFYLLKSVPLLEFIKAEGISLNGESEASLDLKNISSGKKLVDDSVNTMVTGGNIFSYNSRVMQGGIKKWFYKFINSYNFFPCSNENIQKYFDIYVEIKTEGKTSVVKISASDGWDFGFNAGIGAPLCTPRFFFYPHDGAVRVSFGIGNRSSDILYYTYDLVRHPYMVGAYLYNNMECIISGGTSEKPFEEDNDSYEVLSNEIAISNVNNPFSYPDALRLSVGDGEILGISTSAKALSQGQFGQFPIYVFCTDGIWALEIASDGTFSSKQPISRDVCNNPNSITQIDGAVVFTTDQGLKMIQGSEVVLLSGNMNGHNVREDEYFGNEYFASKGEDFAAFDDLVKVEERDFREILKNCSIAYDYPNSMLRIFPANDKDYKGKYYIYDFGTGEFSSCILDKGVDSVVHSYPTSLIQIGKEVFTFDNRSDNETYRQGLILTRPILFDEPSALKKLSDLRLHYSKNGVQKEGEKTYARVVIFVSSDGEKWAEVTSLRRGSYKYYRFGVITNMTDDDALSGMTVRYEVERNNKLR